MHRVGGLMSEITMEERRRQFRWGMVDVLERCPALRECATCELWADCGGRAKDAARRRGGHVLIDDAVVMKGRVSEVAWESEMLCRRPSRVDAVFPEFDERVHVGRYELAGESHDGDGQDGGILLGGMDFGYRSPTVLLWASLNNDNVLWVIDESVRKETRLEAHVGLLAAGGPDRRWGTPKWVGVDPAGHQRSDQTGVSAVSVMRQNGLRVRARRVPMLRGIEAIRARLKPATGSPRLFIHERCTVLIDALKRYHYSQQRQGDVMPVKDGPDHAVDALRYLVGPLDCVSAARVGSYLW